ncbi:CapA family protein [Halorubrum sp. SD690R]|uniref:CapA family protein n=1 Tax=Halorubrum sp. SD690R TaxID=2518117 RepID=UPI0010F8CCF4|nr:CapA family protein [Halorubrum sp. SD690R]TKX48526.1 CapA family protein [Halorubrum sp. SD690R]
MTCEGPKTFSDCHMDTPIFNEPLSASNFGDLLFTGDFNINSEYWNSNPITGTLRERIENAGRSITNFEGSLDGGDPIIKHGPNLSVERSMIETIQDSGFDAVSLANNHVMDYGPSGLLQTQNCLRRFDVRHFGAGGNISSAYEPYVFTSNGTKVGVFGLSEHQEQIVTKEDSGVAWAYDTTFVSQIQKDIEDYDVSVLVAHGGAEYIPIPPRSWRIFLRDCAELGFDLIIGHHPHTPQGWECHSDTPIFYSLGNFAMYRSSRPSTHWSYIVECDIEKESLSEIRVILVNTVDGQVETISPEKTSDKVNYLLESSNIISDNSVYKKYWQEVSMRQFNKIYHRQLSNYGLGAITTFINDPIRAMDKATRRLMNIPPQNNSVGVREYIQNPSHRCIIRTALGVRTGSEVDRRTDSVKKNTQELFDQIETDKNTLQKNIWRIKKLIDRMGDI